MGNPENVIKNLDFVAHRNSSPDVQNEWPARNRQCSIR
jgi:hypothetical protein